MSSENELGTFGFRFSENSDALCGLFAVGHELVTKYSYDWNGQTRNDGPLMLFQYTLSGAGSVIIDNKQYRVEKGKAFMVEIPSEHRYFLPQGEKDWEFIFILMRPHVISPLWRDIVAVLGSIPYLPPRSEPIFHLHEMIRDARLGKINSNFTASYYVYKFVMALSAFTFRRGGERSDWPVSIKLATEYMEKHYANMAGQEELAKELGMSKYQYIRRFTKVVGMTPGEYLSRVRIDKAIELLTKSDISIDEIALRIGYSSGSYLIRVFQKLVGQTPAKFKESNELSYKRVYFD